MLLDQELLRFIFGLKLRSIRQEKRYSLKVLARATGLSPSYINEIEKGKKYPKTDKIILLADALGVAYDDLISLRLKAELRNITQILERNLLKGLPFDVFGIPAHSLFELIADRPHQLSALIGTLLELARAHNIAVEDFFAATLRAFLDMNRNFFPDIEERVRVFEWQLQPDMTPDMVVQSLTKLLTERFGCQVSEEDFAAVAPDLAGLFYFQVQRRDGERFSLNRKLSSREKAFVLAKELGYFVLGVKERPESSHARNLDSYEALVNNLKASYFASALLVPLERFVEEVRTFVARPAWDAAQFNGWALSYPGTMATFYHRLAQVLPTYFNMGEIFYIRFAYDSAQRRFVMVNELHLSQLHGPHRVNASEHYCRRWISSVLLERLATDKSEEQVTGIQRSRFFGSDNEYLCFSTAYRSELEDGRFECSTLGIMVNPVARGQIRFVDDEAIIRRHVGDTCEQCAITPCAERSAPPVHHDRKVREQRVQSALEAVIRERSQ